MYVRGALEPLNQNVTHQVRQSHRNNHTMTAGLNVRNTHKCYTHGDPEATGINSLPQVHNWGEPAVVHRDPQTAESFRSTHTHTCTMESNRVLWKDVTLHVVPRNNGTVTQ